MRKLTGAVVGLAMVLAVAGAWGAELEGQIKEVNASERSFTLQDGTQVWVAEGLSMEKVAEGKDVKVTYEERDGKKIATMLQVAE
jgi:hypothetical protein